MIEKIESNDLDGNDNEKEINEGNVKLDGGKKRKVIDMGISGVVGL